MATISGGCLCGAVRYECPAEAAVSALCYCTDCQRATGGAFSAGFMVPKDSFKLLKGQLKGFEITADSGPPTTRPSSSRYPMPNGGWWPGPAVRIHSALRTVTANRR